MTVKELIDKLAQFHPDLEVVVASDPEGNSHHMLSERMDACYAHEGESTRHGVEFDVVDEDDWEDFAFDHFDDDEDELPPYPGDNCLVIGP